MNWLSFFIGMLVGWLIEWAIDYFFWRRRRQSPEGEEQALKNALTEAKAETQALKSQLEQCQEQEHRLADCEAELRAERDKMQALSERMEAREEEMAILRGQIADADAEAKRSAAALAFAIPSTPPEPDDLKKIEGIGPKIASILNDHDIWTYEQLAATGVSRLQAILDEAGPRYRIANPESWPEQARFAAAGDQDGLKKLQDALVAGRRQPDESGKNTSE